MIRETIALMSLALIASPAIAQGWQSPRYTAQDQKAMHDRQCEIMAPPSVGVPWLDWRRVAWIDRCKAER
jgi:hypothetical protein